MKKYLLVIMFFLIFFDENVYATTKPTVQYIFDNISVENGVVFDQSGNGNDGIIVEDSVQIPVEPFLNADTYTWHGKFMLGGNMPEIFYANSAIGNISIRGAGGSGMPRIFQYELVDRNNDIRDGSMYYDSDIYREQSYHDFVLVHNNGYFEFYLDGERLEPTSYGYDNEETELTLKYVLSGENPIMKLYLGVIEISEFKMFNTALTEEEVKEMLTSEYPKLNAVKYDDGTVQVAINKDEELPADAVLYIAEYDSDGNMQSIRQIKKEELTEYSNYYYYSDHYKAVYTMANPENTIKCFLWNADMQPYASSVKIV